MEHQADRTNESYSAQVGVRIALIASSILLISIAHYSTDTHHHIYHAVYRRLYYLPIFAAALWFGLRGGLGASLSLSLLYAPHILYQWKILPSMELEKYLEILLFNIVGALTGIPEEAMKNLFEAFYTTKEEGTGLGLVIAKKIVEAHGGKIRVESTQGDGTCFQVWLPGTDGGEAG